MIHGIGTDIVHIPRIDACLDRFGERFSRRILTEREWRELQALECRQQARMLAKRFAVKEAAAKALGTGFREGVAMCEIGLGHDTLGRPMLYYLGKTRRRVDELAITASHVSLADEREYCIAYVTLMIKSLA